jgi:hypothetical protein
MARCAGGRASSCDLFVDADEIFDLVVRSEPCTDAAPSPSLLISLSCRPLRVWRDAPVVIGLACNRDGVAAEANKGVRDGLALEVIDSTGREEDVPLIEEFVVDDDVTIWSINLFRSNSLGLSVEMVNTR